MPVSEEKVLEWVGSNSSAEAYPIDQERSTVGKMRLLFYDILAVVNESRPASPSHPHPLFLGLSKDPAIDFFTRDFINEGAVWERCNEYSASKTLILEPTMRAVRRGLAHFVPQPQIRVDNLLYGFHQLMFYERAAAAMHHCIKESVIHMMYNGNPENESSINVNLWIGSRDWHSATAFARAKGVDTAHANENDWRLVKVLGMENSVGHSVYEPRARRSGEGWKGQLDVKRWRG